MRKLNDIQIQIIRTVADMGEAHRSELGEIDSTVLKVLVRSGYLVDNSDGRGDTRYFVSALGYSIFNRSTKKNAVIALPRTYVAKGLYKGIVAPVRRANSDSLVNAPSLHCGTLYYPDGRREVMA